MVRRRRISADYSRLLGAGTVSQLGTQVSALAMSLIAVVAMRASAAQVGVLTACQSGAYLIAGLPAGIIADRAACRRIMLGSDLARAVIIVSVPMSAALHVLTLAQLFAVVFLTGVLTVFADVARQSFVPRLVSREQLTAANSWLAGTASAASIGGPSVAGVLIQVAGAPFAMMADTVSYLLSASLIRGIDADRKAAPLQDPGSLRSQALAGLRFVCGMRQLRDLALASTWYNFITAVTGVVLMLHLARDLNLSATAIGEFYSASSAGGVLGAAASRRVIAMFGAGGALCGAQLTACGAAVLIALTGPGWRLWAGAAGLFVAGTGLVIYNVTQVTLRQRLTPTELLGRTTGGIKLVVTGAAALGSIAGGELAGSMPTQRVLWLAAAALAAAALVMASPIRRAGASAAGHAEDRDWSRTDPGWRQRSRLPAAPSEALLDAQPADRRALRAKAPPVHGRRAR